MHPPFFFQFILALLLLSVAAEAADAAVVGHGEFIYDGFSSYDSNLTVEASATIFDGLLSLTRGPQAQDKGYGFYPYPLNFTDVSNGSSLASFSTTFIFSIVGSYTDMSAHGLALVLCSNKKSFPAALSGQFIGLFNIANNGNTTNHLLAIEIDTIMNKQFNDIDNNHIGIDVNSLISVASRSAGYYTSDGEFHPLSLISRKPMQVWVDYDSKRTMLNVTIAPCCPSSKPSMPLLSIVYDLSPVLPTTPVFVGFSSATGTVNSKHYILGWSFKLHGEAAPLNYSDLSLTTLQQIVEQVPDKPFVQIHSHPHSNKAILLATIIPALGITIVVSATLAKVHMKRRLQARKTEQEWEKEKEYGAPSFTYKDLFAATNGFKDKMLLGRGGFGSVFKGLLPHSKQTVAIKQVSPESKQGMKEFMTEIIILGRLRHRNLVQLHGYCHHKQQLLLVYEYMPNGSLDCYLHTQNQQNTTNLCWAQRFHIIKGIASGLLYLHEECLQVVIHRDIKTSNVLLDREMNAMLGDFGLARSHDHGADAHTTHVAGTCGYIAPELARLGKATKATDVFAFGVLMMEVASGRRPIWLNTDNGEPLALADWVLDAWRGGSITGAADPRLDGHVEEEMELVLKLGLLCSHPSPNARPRMRRVKQFLERDASLPADLQPDTLLSSDLGQDCDEKHYPVAMSCPMTAITDLSKGR